MTKPLLFGPDGSPIRVRNFDAAKGTRFTADWVANGGTADSFLKSDVKTLRDRARDAERNDGYVEGILMALESNVIGQHGIKMKSMARRADARNKKGVANRPDNDARQKIEEAWSDFSKRGNFDVTRQFSRAAFERIAFRSIVRDGGFFVRTVDGFVKNEYGFAVQGIETDMLETRMVDNKRRIHKGIAFDEWDEPLGYYLKSLDQKASTAKSRDPIYVPADNMLHLFMARRVAQSQGFSWLSNALLRLRHLMKFEEAETIAARISASKPGFFKRTAEQGYTGEEDAQGNIKAPTAPGEWEELPHGIEPVMIDPKHPNSAMPEFRKAILRGVSPGVYVNYNTWAQDLEGVSYSSIRQGVLAERDIYRLLHAFFIDAFEVPVFDRWLRMALLMGTIEGYTIADFPRLSHAEFSGRTWSWVDPLKDIEASAKEIELTLNSRQRIARDKGLDFDKLVAENEEDLGKLESAGLPIAVNQPAQPAPPAIDAAE